MNQAIQAIRQPDRDVAATPRPGRRGMIVIPARDEEADVGDVVEQAVALGYPVVVVDDASTDRTAERAAAAGAAVLSLAFHAGSWAAIQAGIRYAGLRDCDYVITMDADGQHDAREIPRLLDGLEPGDRPAVVIGACVERVNLRRRLAWRVLRRLSGLSIADLTSGFRAYNRRAMELLTSSEQTLLEYQDVGVLMCLTGNDARIREVEVRMYPRLHGHSRVYSSWPMVGYYLVYSALIGLSRRGVRGRPSSADRV